MTWIYILNFYINFCAGLFLSLLPRIDMERTGLIYGLLFLCKAMFMIPAGYLGDRFGHQRVLTLAIFLQSLGFTLIALNKELAIYGRSMEGVALACGAVTCIAIFRELSPSEKDFTDKLKLLFGTGSFGYILGPVLGFMSKGLDLQLVVSALAGSSFLFLLVQIFAVRVRTHAVAPVTTLAHPFSLRTFLALIIPLGVIKGLGRAYEPLLSYWSQYSLGLSKWVASLTFVVLGLSFLFGTQRVGKIKKAPLFFAGLCGIFLMEFSLHNGGDLWLISVLLFGLWYGYFLTLGLAYVGWRKASSVGLYTSVWMLISDLGTIFMPMLFWQWRDQDHVGIRAGSTLMILLVVALCYSWYGRKHAPQ